MRTCELEQLLLSRLGDERVDEVVHLCLRDHAVGDADLGGQHSLRRDGRALVAVQAQLEVGGVEGGEELQVGLQQLAHLLSSREGRVLLLRY